LLSVFCKGIELPRPGHDGILVTGHQKARYIVEQWDCPGVPPLMPN